ncbi:DUF2309 domain-containing protein [Mycolicibacterium duvalii]|uniref:Probable inorganic carbon transporter subunit DabA n=1 Tax=Mycolicibacterium duvalii TaxID=39688 RepID=A0A7I7K3V5_9MYCO|nr:DUF2309 domain-containing protein [Mycolicibacterium duvalii]MCV7367643.1 DUF2309 domain-containing protein [Mycolicibacterium duvalii]PEG44057.1 DUF2309 domain-containing protein [Mycolicibacterium duvalii]BBX18767.1 UPF0753 protein [Mycolicibacterium duvalii]
MTNESTARAQVRTDIGLAARVLPTHYPLETFIAVNPLAGLEPIPFEQAVRRAGDLYGVRGTLSEDRYRNLYRAGRISDGDLDRVLSRRYPNLTREPHVQLGPRSLTATELMRADLLHGAPVPAPVRRNRTRAEQWAPELADVVDAHTARWCAAFFGTASWPMPGRERGFYAAWRNLAPRDRRLPRSVRASLRAVPERAEDAVLEALGRAEVGHEERITYLQAHLTRLPGWAAHIHWCTGRRTDIDLTQYLAVRLSYESALLAGRSGAALPAGAPPVLPSARERVTRLVEHWGLTGVTETQLATAARILAALPVSAREALWQNAFEGQYRDGLLAALCRPRTPESAPADIQVVTCIDTRSEGLRRHLEARDGYQTFGFAGFFGVAIRFTGLPGGQPADLCPVLMAPAYDVAERAVDDAAAARRIAGLTTLTGAETAFHAAKDAIAAPFTLADAAGWVAAPWAAAKTVSPAASSGVRRWLGDLMAPAAPTQLGCEAIPLDERVLFAQAALATMGLTRDFGALVVLCAHGSSTENNPYQAALDCGACGGQAGGPNARTAATILNQPEVREALRGNGIDIPPSTLFVAAQHDTATDRVALLDRHLVPRSHHGVLGQLEADLKAAGTALAAERCTTLPGARPRASAKRSARHVLTRSADWAQVYPEWGLAGNAAFIVAPRAVTRGIDLQRRAFLHSYDADTDPDGSALETILTAPLVVAQWINCQYYFSTVAPEAFGAGTKTIHNVVGTAGVLSGQSGDLRLGLPWQSVAAGDRLMHEPLRLLAVVQAPLDRIDMIVDRNPVLQRLFGNDWVAVAARRDAGSAWHRWTRGGWHPWDETESTDRTTEKELSR